MTDAELRDFAKTTPFPVEEWEKVRRTLKDAGMVEAKNCESFDDYTTVTLQSLSDWACSRNISLIQATEDFLVQWNKIKEKWA